MGSLMGLHTRSLLPVVLCALLCGCQSSPLALFGLGAIEVYRTAIRPSHPARCAFDPSCSAYGQQALEELGFWQGSLTISERLLRCHPFNQARYPRDASGQLLDPLPLPAPDEARPRPLFSLVLSPEEEQQLAFARSLDEGGQPDRAATEWLRFLSMFPESNRRDWARLRLGQSLVQAADLAGAQHAFAQVPPGPWWFHAQLQRAQVLDRLERPAEARTLRAELLAAAGDDEQRQAVLLTDALASAEAGDRDHAQQQLQRAAAEHSQPQARAYLLEQSAALQALPARNPWLAVGLSALVPGSGQLYAGQAQDGLFTFLLNLACIGGAVLAAVFDEPVTAGVLGFTGLVFYSGNLYGAVRAADLFNRQQQVEFAGDTRHVLNEQGWLQPCSSLGP